jgi:hypothetical protein
VEVRLEDRLEDQLQRGLDDPVGGGGASETSQFARCLGGRLLPHPLRRKPAGLERSSQLAKQPPRSGADSARSDPIDTGSSCTLVPRTRLHATTRKDGSYTRGCASHRSDGQEQPSPTGAASPASCVPAARPRPGRATARRCSPAAPPSAALLRPRWAPSPSGRLSRPRTTALLQLL